MKISLNKIYNEDIPDFLGELLNTPPMERIKKVGMHCGCEYTSFPLFKTLGFYSRYEHSLGAALIVWHFTSDMKQAIATLFHDIATPSFAHTIDFMNGDYLTQESTELGTDTIIRNSKEIVQILNKYHINIDDVIDYHKYPIADNDSPKLSSDRLEYSFGNAVNFNYLSYDELVDIYNDLEVIEINNTYELAFKHLEYASRFANTALKCGKIYVSDYDRYSMQMLSELVKEALNIKVITINDLYQDEEVVINKLLNNKQTKDAWLNYRQLAVITNHEVNPLFPGRIISAKKRYINPLVKVNNKYVRLTDIDFNFKNEIDEFLNEKQDQILYGDF